MRTQYRGLEGLLVRWRLKQDWAGPLSANAVLLPRFGRWPLALAAWNSAQAVSSFWPTTQGAPSRKASLSSKEHDAYIGYRGTFGFCSTRVRRNTGVQFLR
jgi:hypothetical protein